MTEQLEFDLDRLGEELRARAEPEFRLSQDRFFKEPVTTLGVRTADVRRLAADAAREYRSAGLSLDDILEIIDALWAGGALEERMLGILILARFRGDMTAERWPWLDARVDTLTNWAETDAFCIELLAPLLRQEPDLAPKVVEWTAGRHRWRRRAAAVAFAPLSRHGEYVEQAFAIVDRLGDDDDPMVQKAVGWLLRETSRKRPREIADYLIRNADRLPRSNVRYASEKLPSRLRVSVMSA